ncbi:hypothetical protein D3C84_787040 [compost metagenome]
MRVHLQRWGRSQSLLDSLRRNGGPALQPATISDLDQQWRNELESPRQPLIDSIRQLPASALLAGIQRQHAPLFNELILTDQRGLIVGMSEVTSDYWQGDEAKFNNARTLKPDQLLIEPISYDASTQSFQVQVSAPLHDPQQRDFLGVLTFGINIEAAFSDSQPCPFEKAAQRTRNFPFEADSVRIDHQVHTGGSHRATQPVHLPRLAHAGPRTRRQRPRPHPPGGRAAQATRHPGGFRALGKRRAAARQRCTAAHLA